MVSERTTVVRTAEEGTVGETVVFAVAAARDVRPTEIETPLYAAIDADALERFLSGARGSNRGSARVGFSWAGCDVVVHATGRVVVTTSTGGAGESTALAD